MNREWILDKTFSTSLCYYDKINQISKDFPKKNSDLAAQLPNLETTLILYLFVY